MKVRENNRLLLHKMIMLLAAVIMIIAAGSLASHSAWADEDETPAKLSKTKVTIKQFNSKQLSMKNTDGSSVVWSSTNTGVARVDKSSGLVTAVGGGSCKVIANYKDKNYTCTVKVTPLKLNQTSLTLVVRREGFQLKLNNKSLNGVSWSSSRSSVATVSSSGYVTPHNAGSATITARYSTAYLTCSVRVLEASVGNLRKYRSPKSSSNKKKVVFAGAGLFDRWGSGLYAAFGSTDVINNAIPHSTLANWKSWTKKLITSYKPKALVLCIGSEDIGAGGAMTADQCTDALKNLIAKIRKKSSSTKIFVCALPCYPDRPNAWDTINEVNDTMKKYCSGKKKVTFLNLNSVLMKNGTPIARMFKEEGKNALSADGYAAIKNVIVKKVKKAAK